MRQSATLVTVTAGLLTLAGCNASFSAGTDSGSRSSSTQCSNGICTINLTGEQTLDLDVAGLERELRVGPIEPGAVTIAVRGDSARLAAGESRTIGGLSIRVISAGGRNASLEVRRA